MAPSSIRPAYARPGLASLRASVGFSAVRWPPSSWPSCSLEAVCLALISSLRSSPSLASAQLPCWAQKPKDELSNIERRWATRLRLYCFAVSQPKGTYRTLKDGWQQGFASTASQSANRKERIEHV